MVDAVHPLVEAQEDETIIKINRRNRQVKFKLDDSLVGEMKGFVIFGQKTRKAFEPNSAADLKQLIEEMEQTQAYRDRLTGIMIQARMLVGELEILIKSGTAYLYTQYHQEMKACSNKETREAALRYVLEPVIRRKEQWQRLLEIAELAKTNLNETYFALREIGENGRTILEARKVKRAFD